MGGSALYFVECAFKVVHCTSASGTGNIFRSVEPSACSLHQFICQIFCVCTVVQVLFLSIFKIGSPQFDFIEFLVEKPFPEITGKIKQQTIP